MGKLTRALALAAVVPACLFGPRTLPAQQQSPRTVIESLVEARADDGILNSGAMFLPANGSPRPIAIIWVHGNGVNFYSPTYVTIGRELAKLGFATMTVNTRMHDLGNVAGWRGETRIRGGSYWGVTSEQVRDLAGWIDFAKQQGFARVVLVGHSAGATAVQLYQAQRQDARVAGLVLASGRFRPGTAPVDSFRLKEAARFVAEGRGEEAPQLPNAPRLSITSATTLLDLADMGVQLTDFYGVEAADPPVSRVRCPILAWFGTRGDVGTAADLELLVTTLKRHSAGPSRVTTALIQNADHMYGGAEAQVAQTLARWMDDVVTKKP